MKRDVYGGHLAAATRGHKEPADQLDYEKGVRCVVMPCCGFTFDACHTDDRSDPPTYTCPLCHA